MNNLPFDEIKIISRDANEMWTLWKSFFLDILNKHAPITYMQVKRGSLTCDFDEKHILKLFSLSSCQYVSTIPEKNLTFEKMDIL